VAWPAAAPHARTVEIDPDRINGSARTIDDFGNPAESIAASTERVSARSGQGLAPHPIAHTQLVTAHHGALEPYRRRAALSNRSNPAATHRRRNYAPHSSSLPPNIMSCSLNLRLI
jgi:hypothetical protein